MIANGDVVPRSLANSSTRLNDSPIVVCSSVNVADTPLGRPGQPGELAPLYVFLATDDSQYISGEVIGATGGKPLH